MPDKKYDPDRQGTGVAGKTIYGITIPGALVTNFIFLNEIVRAACGRARHSYWAEEIKIGGHEVWRLQQWEPSSSA